jgi:NNP family nitrate/nitrite transporter-like MFS transporter
MQVALRNGHWPWLLAAWLHFEISFVVWLLIGALSILIVQEFVLTPTQIGFLVGMPLLGGAVLRIPVGLASDHLGIKRTGLTLLLVEAAGLIWAWLYASDYLQLLTVGLLLGSAGASFAVALPLASHAYPRSHQGLAMGVAASGNSGTFLAAYFAPRLAESVGWHGVFGLMLLPLAVTVILFAALVPGQERGRDRAWASALKEVLQHRSVYTLSGLYAVTFGGFVGFCSFLPVILYDHYRLDLITAGSITALCGLGGSLARPLGGHVADRLGARRVLAVILCIIAGLIALAAIFLDAFWSVGVLMLGVTGMGFGNGVVFRSVSERFQPHIGLASGVIGAAGGLGGFVLPVCLGILKDATGSYRFGFWVFAAMAATAWVSTFSMSRYVGPAGEGFRKRRAH